MSATEVRYPDGGKYIGPIREDSGLPYGVGIKILPDGSKYAGNIQSGLFQGCGVMTFPDGSKYEGEFTSGKFHGVGIIHNAEGVSFCGEFRDGRVDGKGQITFQNGTHGLKRQEGTFLDGILQTKQKCQAVIERAKSKAEEAQSVAGSL